MKKVSSIHEKVMLDAETVRKRLIESYDRGMADSCEAMATALEQMIAVGWTAPKETLLEGLSLLRKAADDKVKELRAKQ